MTEFDVHRALLVRGDIFAPFRVKTTRPLRAALERRIVRANEPVVVTECSAAPVVLLKQHLAFHHVAQGEIAGEPWLVSL
jgi:hypothetical protein